MRPEIPKDCKPRGFWAYALHVDCVALKDAWARHFRQEAFASGIAGVLVALVAAARDGWSSNEIMDWFAYGMIAAFVTLVLSLVVSSARSASKTYSDVATIAIKLDGLIDSRKFEANDALFNLIKNGKKTLDGLDSIDPGKLHETIFSWKVSVENTIGMFRGNLDFSIKDFYSADRKNASEWATGIIGRLENMHFKVGGVRWSDGQKFIMDHKIDLILHLDRLDSLYSRWRDQNVLGSAAD